MHTDSIRFDAHLTDFLFDGGFLSSAAFLVCAACEQGFGAASLADDFCIFKPHAIPEFSSHSESESEDDSESDESEEFWLFF